MSNVSNYLRMAVMFSGNHAHTFISNLEKMIEVVLNEKAPKAMLVDEIVECLAEQYNLKFTDVEVTQAIEGKRGKEHIYCINAQVNRQGDRKYILNQQALDSIAEKNRGVSTESICELFLGENPSIEITTEAMVELVDKYFYRCFNTNATVIMQLLKQEYSDGVLLSDSDLDSDFGEEEKEILNSFIYWNNETKDKFVYQMVSCCFDYCTMTAKKDQSVYESVFKNKVFVLDTNIIFRVLGINRGSRKVLIDAFLEKCNEVGIELVVTNITRDEMRSTISYNADQISNLISNSAPVNPRHLKGCANTGVNEDFYQSYYEWCQKPGHICGNVGGFREDLLDEADKVCRGFSNKTYTSYSVTNKELFSSYVEDLKEHKAVYKKHTPRIETIETDVNNFMFVVGMNERKHANDFFDLNYFHISADHPFCNWAKKVRQGAIPEVILPSVWYSIILHYSGRATRDDYASFTRFLNFSLSTDEERSEQKTLLIQKTARLNEPIDVKEEIIQDVAKKLSSEYKDADDQTIDELIEASRETATERRVNEAVESERASNEETQRDKDEYYAEQIRKMQNQHETSITELRELIKLQDENQKKELDERDKRNIDNVIEARRDERNTHIEIEAKTKAHTKKRWYLGAFILCILLFLGTAAYGVIKVWNKVELKEGTAIAITALCGIGALVLEFIVFKAIFENWFCGLKYTNILEREKKMLEEKYPKVQ